MAMTYTESATLMIDMQFRGRIKVACLTFASYITGEEPTTPAHNTRIKWAQQCFASPDASAAQIQPTVVMDSKVQEAGGDAISDADLQSAVETSVNKII
jgi:hypothetical protein